MMDTSTLTPYVTNLDRPVFALRNLPEEVVAVLFAYYSRSTGGLRENLAKLAEDGDIAVGAGETEDVDLARAREKAREFHEKWVVGYGHSSVAEHAVVHLAVEDVSILASKVIEDARLASFTEKSTRYVVFDEDRYYAPPCFADSTVYREACRFLLGTYASLMPGVIEEVRKRRPRTEKQSQRGWDTACKAAACDVLRYILPTSTRTNIGITANARTLEHLLAKLMSHPLQECRDLGESMKREAQIVVPTLIKYAARSPYLVESGEALDSLAEAVGPSAGGAVSCQGDHVSLVSGPANPELDLAAALVYEHSERPWAEVRQAVEALGPEKRREIIEVAVRGEESGGFRARFDQPIRALEHLYYTFEITLDFGAFRDIQRHRMATQSRQRLTDAWGYSTPPEIAEFGLSDIFAECMERASNAYQTLVPVDRDAASYVLPLASRVRVLFTWNLRELHHFISLRSGKQGHASYRRIAQDLWKALHERDPLMAEFIRVDMCDYGLSRA
ncbi:MAG TPA: FAD-dependent thymidylate synthase [Armatimonadota bacterium]|jgi:thymidylate synthase ThyX